VKHPSGKRANKNILRKGKPGEFVSSKRALKAWPKAVLSEELQKAKENTGMRKMKYPSSREFLKSYSMK